MDRDSLRALQAPLRERYAADPTSAVTPLRAVADFRDDGITCTVDGFAGRTRAGLHPAAGGDGADACSGDMLLQALLACAGVTLRSVATSMGIEVRSARLTAESTFDARGTLGLSRDVPVGIGPVTVTVELDADVDEAAMTRLGRSTERYCVVGQSLRVAPTIRVIRLPERPVPERSATP